MPEERHPSRRVATLTMNCNPARRCLVIPTNAPSHKETNRLANVPCSPPTVKVLVVI
jgi:hypothetical protein